jgi:hypothetical protein
MHSPSNNIRGVEVGSGLVICFVITVIYSTHPAIVQAELISDSLDEITITGITG